MTGNDLGTKKLAIIAIIILSLIPIYFMHIDRFFSADEYITYSMSNNDKGGFVFSEGRISKYVREQVIADTPSETISNILATALDVLENRKNSALFTSERETEVQLFSHEEMVDWFAKRPDERFNIGDTMIFALSDDGNAYGYYCLVNIVSSLFLLISGTKWSGFIVNFIFFALTIVELWKLGKSIKNSDAVNYCMLACFCIWKETIHTVTNMRAYGVTSFWATMLVIFAVRIFISIMDEDRIKKSDLVKFVVVYALGYVTHFTIGAVLSTLGVTLVVFMLIQKKKHLEPVIVTGIIALISGFIIAPDSLADLLTEYSNKGTVDMPGDVLVVMIAATVLFIGLIVYAVKKREVIKDPFYYCSVAMLLEFMMIMYGTNRVGYSRVAFPVFFLLVVSALLRLVERGMNRYLYIAAVCVFGMVNLYLGYNLKTTENAAILAKRAAIENAGIIKCIYFRERSRGYQDSVLLRDYFEEAQVITVDTEGWQDMVDFDPSGEDRVICFFTDDSRSEDAIDWVKSIGYKELEEIYTDPETQVYIATK